MPCKTFIVSDEHHNVAAALLVRDGLVLLCHRHPLREWYPDVWDIPGGHINPDETPAIALHRELEEELGISVELSQAEPWRVISPTPDITLHVWIVDKWSGTVTNRTPDEHDQIRWFRPDEIEHLDLADAYVKELINSQGNDRHRST